MKYRPGFPADGFATLAEAQDWVQQFTEWYNHEHRHSALRYVTPSQRHNGEAKGILTQRREVIEAAPPGTVVRRHPETQPAGCSAPKSRTGLSATGRRILKS
ncbi:integrase core domain-containing protein [Halomonas sp. MS1]